MNPKPMGVIMKIKYGWRTDSYNFSEVTDDDSASTLYDVVTKLMHQLKNDKMHQLKIDNWQSDYKFFNHDDEKFIELSYTSERIGYDCFIKLYKDILMDINGTLVVLPYWGYNEH